MATRSEHIEAFRQIDALLRDSARASAQALAAHRSTPAESDVERHFEHTLDRLARLHGRGTFEALSIVELFQTAIDREVQLAQESSGADATDALARARALVDVTRRVPKLTVHLAPVNPLRGALVEPLRPEFVARLHEQHDPFVPWRNGGVVIVRESELNDLRAAGDQVDVLFLEADELLNLALEGHPAKMESEFARRSTVARATPDHVGDDRESYRLRQLLTQSTLLRNLRDRLKTEHPSAHDALLSVLQGHRTTLEARLSAGASAARTTSNPLDETIERERALQTLVKQWAAEPEDTAGLNIRFQVVANAGTHLATLEQHRR